MRGKLSATMTLREFENGYWYRKQLKDFAEGSPILDTGRT